MIKFVLLFLRYCTKRQLPAVHFRLEFPMSQFWVPANELLIGLERKVFIISTKRENKLKIFPLGVLCFLSPRDNQGESLARI